MAVVTITTAVTLAALVHKILSLRRDIKDTDSEVMAMLDGVVDILEQLQKMEQEETRMRSRQLDDNVEKVHELRNQLKKYMTRSVVGKALRQSKARKCLSDLDTALDSLVTLHEALCESKTEENLRRLNVWAQSFYEAMEDSVDSTLIVSASTVAPIASVEAIMPVPKVQSITMSSIPRSNTGAFASVNVSKKDNGSRKAEYVDLCSIASTVLEGEDEESNTVMHCLEMLESGVEHVQTEALWTMNQISKHGLYAVDSSRATAALLTVIERSNTLPKVLATRVLGNLARTASVDKTALSTQGISMLLSLLEECNDRVVFEAASTLSILARSCAMEMEIVAVGGLEKLVAIAKQPQWERVTVTVLATLCTLVRDRPANLETFKIHQGIDVLVHIVRTDSEEAIIAACCALRCLMASFPDVQREIESAGGVASLKERTEIGSEKEHEAAAKALRCLTESYSL